MTIIYFWLIMIGFIFQANSKNPFPCGVKPVLTKDHVKRIKRIVGGHISTVYSWPWLVNFIDIKDGLQYCSGSIINNQWILTAAHCFIFYEHPTGRKVSPLPSYAYHVADHVLNQTGIHEYTVEASELYIDPNYEFADERHPGQNDIALIKLKKELNFTKYVRPICLPDGNNTIPGGYGECYLAGWGNVINKPGYYRSHVLKETKLNIVSLEKCNDKQSFDGIIPKSFLCAGFRQGGTDGCYGDSGAPLQCYYNGAYHVTGIMSWGNGCGTAGFYGVYANVTYSLSFIENILKGPNQQLITYHNARRKKCHLMTRKMYDLFTNESYFNELDLVRTFQMMPHEILLLKQISLVDFCHVANALNFTTNITTVGSILKTYVTLVDKLETFNQLKTFGEKLSIKLLDIINLSKLSLTQLLSLKNKTEIIKNIEKIFLKNLTQKKCD